MCRERIDQSGFSSGPKNDSSQFFELRNLL